FLQGLLQSYSTGLNARNCYEDICDERFCLKGLLTSAIKPKILLRYEKMNTLLDRIAEATGDRNELLDNGHDIYRRRIFDEWEIGGRKKFAEAHLAKETTSRVFVTFPDTEDRLPDESKGPARLMRTLGIPMADTDPVVKVIYKPLDEDVLCFPTIADAGWFPYFKPAKTGDPHGWTEPIGDPTAKGYPEAVHPNRKISQAAECPQIIEIRS
ncbi:MAG: hypothetical protein ACRENG_11405, partial [bacterium]